MISLFTDVGRSALRAFFAKPVLCLFDFDGTLAPLASDPDRVSLPYPIQRRLQALQRRTPVGIITGRSLTDMTNRLAFEPDYLIGNHGLEGLPDWQRSAPDHYAICRQWQTTLAGIQDEIGGSLWIEDKAYSLTLHYRQAADPSSVEQALIAKLSTWVPSPRIIVGKCNLSLLPPNAGDKGQAVQRLLASSPGCGALYVGDDQTDEDVFALHHPAIFSVRVGDEARSAARFGVTDHADMERLLDLLLDLLSGRASEPPMVFGARRQ